MFCQCCCTFDISIQSYVASMKINLYSVFPRLEYEQGKLLQDIREVVARFDAELRIIRHDKFRMDIVMKDADLR